jgi:hypothetical protein
MFDEMERTPRREFLGHIGLLAAAAALPATAAAAEPRHRAAPASPWDMSWVEKVTAAPYKCVLDVQNASDDPLYTAADILDKFREVYGVQGEQMRVVLVVRRLGVPMALEHSLWERYHIGEDRKIEDPVTKAPARRNPFLTASPNKNESYKIESKLEPLMARGVIVLVCNRAAMNWASGFAEKFKRPVADVQNEVRSGLIPGALLMPDGVFALVRAQNAGCAIYKD